MAGPGAVAPVATAWGSTDKASGPRSRKEPFPLGPQRLAECRGPFRVEPPGPQPSTLPVEPVDCSKKSPAGFQWASLGRVAVWLALTQRPLTGGPREAALLRHVAPDPVALLLPAALHRSAWCSSLRAHVLLQRGGLHQGGRRQDAAGGSPGPPAGAPSSSSPPAPRAPVASSQEDSHGGSRAATGPPLPLQRARTGVFAGSPLGAEKGTGVSGRSERFAHRVCRIRRRPCPAASCRAAPRTRAAWRPGGRSTPAARSSLGPRSARGPPLPRGANRTACPADAATAGVPWQMHLREQSLGR